MILPAPACFSRRHLPVHDRRFDASLLTGDIRLSDFGEHWRCSGRNRVYWRRASYALRKLGARIEGVLGSTAERGAERAQGIGGVPKAYATLDDVLADPKVQVVHVTSPNIAHFPQVMQILAAGRHVICEKPLAMTVHPIG